MDPRSQFGPNADKYLTSAVHANTSALARLVEIASPNGGVAVDVATGAGHMAYAIAPHVDLMIATDITPDMLRVTRDAAKTRGLDNFRVLFGTAEHLPFATDSLDGVSCRLGGHHFVSARSFVRESARALKPGGWFLLVDSIGSEDQSTDEMVDRLERVRDPSHVRNIRRSEWLAMAQEVGLTIAHEETGPREIDAEDWMERMNVSEADRSYLRDLVNEASGESADYLNPRTVEGRLIFDLQEIILFARR